MKTKKLKKVIKTLDLLFDDVNDDMIHEVIIKSQEINNGVVVTCSTFGEHYMKIQKDLVIQSVFPSSSFYNFPVTKW